MKASRAAKDIVQAVQRGATFWGYGWETVCMAESSGLITNMSGLPPWEAYPIDYELTDVGRALAADAAIEAAKRRQGAAARQRARSGAYRSLGMRRTRGGSWE